MSNPVSRFGTFLDRIADGIGQFRYGSKVPDYLSICNSFGTSATRTSLK